MFARVFLCTFSLAEPCSVAKRDFSTCVLFVKLRLYIHRIETDVIAADFTKSCTFLLFCVHSVEALETVLNTCREDVTLT